MKHAFLSCIIFFFSLSLSAQSPDIDLVLKKGDLEIKPSFNNCSYYFYPEGVSEKEYIVDFRRKGTDTWHATFTTISDLPVGVWKGSIFGLEEDTEWQLRVRSSLDSSQIVFQEDFRTWTSNPPIAKVIDLSKLTLDPKGGIVITDKGQPYGWVKYTAPIGWVLKREYIDRDAQTAAILVKNAKYVILENVRIEGGYNHGIEVFESEYIRIINCDISGWGRLGKQVFTNKDFRGNNSLGRYLDSNGKVINYDAGVKITHSLGTVIERSYIHDPRLRANSWMFSHPTGPSAVYVWNSRGSNVIRYNDMIGSDEHRWNDVIESSENGSATGGFYRDSDIYGNYLAFGNDDSAELEGGGMNIRFYQNKVEGTLMGVSTGATILGPQFVFGNLITNLGDESGLTFNFFKNGHGNPQGGRRYYLNNTLYGRHTAPYHSYHNPIPHRQISFMRNNIFSSANQSPVNWAKWDDFDNDLFWIENDLQLSRELLLGYHGNGLEINGMAGDPQMIDPIKGNYQLAASSIAVGKSVVLVNITLDGENMGAFINGVNTLPFRPFALSAYPQELNFINPVQRTVMEVSLSLPASEKQAVKFDILKNKVSNWFQVSPSSGELNPGESIKLRIKLDKNKLYGRPLFRGAFIVRTPDGLSRPISLYAKGKFKENLKPSAAPNTVYIETANLPGMAAFTKTADNSSVSKGKYIELNEDSKEISMEAEFIIKKPGKYFLLMRMAIKENRRSRKFQLTLDNNHEETFQYQPGYRWGSVDENDFRVMFLQEIGVELQAGKHQVSMKAIDGNINLNQVIITDNPEVFFEQYWYQEQE
ncbi:right-handed parallel beta-helix repeat-containing protein [uncultured Cyclobacterium sp.]|uniref:right-handed parallel beta-helix repeat-containing protein n=1 Tax=uncultured Cyclobacterium sp. TaxID=453820 RepID=UPI0030EB5E02|tara:strand:+ start:287376 stop:289823 length:2448 start_codon:yes stop_codon:yes gene_type:complete